MTATAPRYLLSLALGLLGCIGCGRAEYEAAVTRTQERLQQLDREHSLLGEPVPLANWQPPVFLRLPLGLSPTNNELASPAPDWLASFCWDDARALVPPLELFVGTHLRLERYEEIETELIADLKKHGVVAQRSEEQGTPREYVRLVDPPEDRVGIRYRRFVLVSDEVPLWPAPKRAAIPKPCRYRYEAYLHDGGAWWVVVVFKHLDRDATARIWKDEMVDASMIRRLPILDRERFAEQREACLATLRVGTAARQRFQAWQGP